LFEGSEAERRIWRQLPEEARQDIAELLVAVLIEYLVRRAHEADVEVGRE